MRGQREIRAAFAGAPLGETLAGASSAADLVQRVVQHVASAVGADDAAFAVPTDDGRHILLTSAGAATRAPSLSTFSLSDAFPEARAIRSGEPVFLRDPPSDDRASPELDRGGLVAYLPVHAGTGVDAALVLRFGRTVGLDDGDRAALSDLAGEVGQAFERVRLLDAALVARARLVALAEASARFLEAGSDRGALLAAATAALSSSCGDTCLVDLLPEECGAGPRARWHSNGVAAPASPEVVRALAEAVHAEVRTCGDTVFRPLMEPGALAAQAPGAGPWLERHPVHGLLAAPLRVAGKHMGVLAVLRHRPHAPYSMDDRLLLEGMADRVAVAIAFQGLAAREHDAARRQTRLAAAARALSEAQGDPEEVRRAIVQSGAACLSARLTLWILTEGGTLEAVAAHPLPRGAPRPEPFCPETSAAAEAVRTGLTTATAGRESVETAGRRARTVMAVPLRVEGGIVGALTVSRRVGRRTFDHAEATLLSDLATHAALALAHARKRTELEAERQRLSEVLASAEGASRAKDEFIAMLSHELRNPLSPIVTALELMRLHAPAAVERERIVIERQVNHLVRLVDDLLDVSRVMRGKVQLERRLVPLTEVIGRAVEQASPLLEERRHTLLLEVAEGLTAQGDERRLAQIVANLLTNAARYTDPEGRIVLRATREAREIKLSVIDNGIGISPALLPRIFDLFVQGERALDRAPGGLGIGLTIVRSLVDLHGGRVQALSNGRGQGSTFTVWLPLASSEAVGASTVRPRARPAPVPTGVRILVVDDNEDAAELLADVLRARGHEVRVAYDGPTALAAVEDEPPRIALLDLGLPVMDGFELARRLRDRLGPGAPSLVAVTGYGQEPDRLASAQAGFDVHMVKPVDLDDICAVVDRLAGPGAASA